MRDTDPYGSLSYVIGNADDFICFDYVIDGDNVRLHSVINSETGGFIETIVDDIVPKNIAFSTAYAMIDDAITWMAENDIEHDEEGWNQDCYFFLRNLANDIETPKRNLSSHSLRFGGGMTDQWLKEKFILTPEEWYPAN